MRGAAMVLLGLASLPASLQAQGDCFPARSSNEAKTFAIFSVALAFSGAGAPERSAPAALRVGFEGSYLPNVDESTATPTTCRPGKGPENTNLLPAFPRPRIAVALPASFTLEASWVPPIRVEGVKANLFSLSLARSFDLGTRAIALALRTHATVGSVRAPITCDDQALGDVQSECFGGTRSDDKFSPNIFGIEVALGGRLGSGRLYPYVGGGYNRLQPRFQVNFTNQFGETDNRKVEVDLNRAVVFAGATWAVTPLLGVTAELYAAPADAVTGRLVMRAAVN